LSASLLFFVACGGSHSSAASNPSAPASPQEQSSAITIYIHGYVKAGYQSTGVYGDMTVVGSTDGITNLTGFSTAYNGANTDLTGNVIVATTYYGSQPPAYYTEQDIREVDDVTAQYGGGIPRYALIVAKYVKHVMEETGAQKVNLMSVSMGSLIARWMIEKNLAGLAGEQKIAKWMSAEGVVSGNYVSSDAALMGLANIYERQSPEVDQMSYGWIERNLGNRSIGSSPYYQNIVIGFESSNRDDALYGLLSQYLKFQNEFYANDGYQLVQDTFFTIQNQALFYGGLPPVRSFFYENHISIKNNPAAWVQASVFIKSNKRVRISLENVTVDDIHQDASGPSAVVFGSAVSSHVLYEAFGVTQAIDWRDINGGSLPVQYYHSNGETQQLNQPLFDNFVDPQEGSLALSIDPYKLTESFKYGIGQKRSEQTISLGRDNVDIPLQNGSYPVAGEGWHGDVRVEIHYY